MEPKWNITDAEHDRLVEQTQRGLDSLRKQREAHDAAAKAHTDRAEAKRQRKRAKLRAIATAGGIAHV